MSSVFELTEPLAPMLPFMLIVTSLALIESMATSLSMYATHFVALPFAPSALHLQTVAGTSMSVLNGNSARKSWPLMLGVCWGDAQRTTCLASGGSTSLRQLFDSITGATCRSCRSSSARTRLPT